MPTYVKNLFFYLWASACSMLMRTSTCRRVFLNYLMESITLTGWSRIQFYRTQNNFSLSTGYTFKWWHKKIIKILLDLLLRETCKSYLIFYSDVCLPLLKGWRDSCWARGQETVLLQACVNRVYTIKILI